MEKLFYFPRIYLQTGSTNKFIGWGIYFRITDAKSNDNNF